ncbi:hypothetical protein [Rummeliibacillus pycnus]|uniref:hypothetical protein n=1 Tax=Rummeliibacillus pycnus TaxID=101070 RepID=UPI003D2D1B33
MGENRATRIDKKRDVKPTVHTDFKNAVYRLADISDISVMDLIEEMTIHALRSKRILEDLSPHFVRSVRFKNILYPGHGNAEHVGHSSTGVNYVRMKTRLTADTFEDLNDIAIALDIRPARACAVLIHESFHSQYFMDNFIKRHLQANITDRQLLELKKIMEYIERDVNYNVSWATLLSYIVQEVKEPAKSLKEKVNTFVIRHWKDR